MLANDNVRARIDSTTKHAATAALAAMGLSVSDAIRMLMHRIAEEKRLPFEVIVPNAQSRAAMAELEAGKGKRFSNADALFDDLGI
jgi:DNA-damage-inducible protein J